MKKATFAQYLQIGKMIESGAISSGLAQAIIERRIAVVNAEPLTEVSSLSAQVKYNQPAFEELKRRFPAYVQPDYNCIRFNPIDRCKDVPMDVENSVVAFEYVHLDHDASTDEVLAEMDRKGLRPALYEELLGFAEKYPEEQRKYPIVALGSETRVDGHRSVAFLWNADNGRHLHLDWIGDDWRDDYRFLAVRK